MGDTAEPKAYLISRVREALAQDPRVNEITIQVTVTGNKVFLHGNVATRERKDAISEVVNELLPDHEIFNETNVESYEPATDVEQLS
jgi:hypothetical protein